MWPVIASLDVFLPGLSLAFTSSSFETQCHEQSGAGSVLWDGPKRAVSTITLWRKLAFDCVSFVAFCMRNYATARFSVPSRRSDRRVSHGIDPALGAHY